jgi:hypothetical protein
MEKNTKKKKLTKEEIKAQAMEGMAIGFDLVEGWKKKFNLTLLIRVALIMGVVILILKVLQINGVF